MAGNCIRGFNRDSAYPDCFCSDFGRFGCGSVRDGSWDADYLLVGFCVRAHSSVDSNVVPEGNCGGAAVNCAAGDEGRFQRVFSLCGCRLEAYAVEFEVLDCGSVDECFRGADMVYIHVALRV